MDIELDSLRPVGGLLGLGDYGAMVDDVKDLSVFGLSAAAGYVAADMAVQKIGYIADRSPAVKGAVVIAAGFVAGMVAAKAHPTVGAGFGGGMVANGVVRLARGYVPGLAGLGAGEELLLGLGNNTNAEDWHPIPGQVDGVRDVEPGLGMPGYIG